MNKELERVDSILSKTIDVMEEGRDEVFVISENSRIDLMHREAELLKTQNLITFVIEEINQLETAEKESRILYNALTKDDSNVSSIEISKAQAEAEKLLSTLKDKRQLEKTLIMRRTTLEFHIKNAKDVLQHAESLTNKMGAALEYLTGSLLEEIAEAKISRNLGMQIIRVQEEERKRISREIHDGPAQFMANVVMKADLCEKLLNKDPGRTRRELGDLKKQVRNSIGDIRRIIFDLMPMSIEDLGLIPTSLHYIEGLKKKHRINISFSYNKGSKISISNLVSLSVFRIIQESLNNVIKHAEANKVDVDLNIDANELYLKIRDDGKGFVNRDRGSFNINSGFGIFGMKERVRLLDGEFKIMSTEDGIDGCEINVKIPLK